MAIIFTTHNDETGRRSIRMYETNVGAKVAKWCRADSGLYPDRCYCILENLQNGVATHFAVEYDSIDGKRVAYRQGYCAKCAPEYAKGRKLHPIPGVPKREAS